MDSLLEAPDLIVWFVGAAAFTWWVVNAWIARARAPALESRRQSLPSGPSAAIVAPITIADHHDVEHERRDHGRRRAGRDCAPDRGRGEGRETDEDDQEGHGAG